jgi:hypothetical protein
MSRSGPRSRRRRSRDAKAILGDVFEMIEQDLGETWSDCCLKDSSGLSVFYSLYRQFIFAEGKFANEFGDPITGLAI